MKRLFVALMLLSLSTIAAAKDLLNLDGNGVAIQGYDPIAFFTDSRPVKGNPQFQSEYRGAKYYFVSAEHKPSSTKNRRSTSRSLVVTAHMGPAKEAERPSRSKHGRS